MSLIPLCVSPDHKEKIKSLGALWHGGEKCWYVPEGINPRPFLEWIPRYYLNEIDPKFIDGPVLEVEAIPRRAMFSNVRSLVEQEDWDKIRKWVYRRAGWLCQVCGCKGDEWPVECHEKWLYDDETKTQRLIDLVSLCPDCHQVKHIGLAQQMGKFEDAMAHMMEVNQWSREKAERYLLEFSEVYEERSSHEWALDVSWLEQLGYNIVATDRWNDKALNARNDAILKSQKAVSDIDFDESEYDGWHFAFGGDY